MGPETDSAWGNGRPVQWANDTLLSCTFKTCMVKNKQTNKKTCMVLQTNITPTSSIKNTNPTNTLKLIICMDCILR